jgi:hypothetical protein
MARRGGNRRDRPRFPVGCLVSLVSDKGIPPEGFRPGGGFEVHSEEIPEGSVGIVVNPPFAHYFGVGPGQEIMSWVLVLGVILEVPHFHMRRCDDAETAAG